MPENSTDWARGYACAIGTLLKQDGATTYVKEAFRCQFRSVADAQQQGADEDDLAIFRDYQHELES